MTRLTAQTADRVEELFNARLPPSRRLDKYKPLSSDLADSARSEKGNTDSNTSASVDPMERLADAQEARRAEVRAEVSDELSLALAVTQGTRRGSDISAFSAQTNALAAVSPPGAADSVEDTTKLGLNLWGKGRRARKIAKDTGAEENGVYYDMSYWRAAFLATRLQWAICFVTIGAACKSRH